MPIYTDLLQTPANNDQEVVAADLEGTLSAGATWSGMRAWLEANGRQSEFQQFLRQRLFQVVRYRLGLIRDVRAFKEQWIDALFKLFAGYSEAEFTDIAEFVVEQELWPKRRQSVIADFMAHTAHGRRLLIVTGVNEPVLAKFAAKLGVEAIGTPLQFVDGRFSGDTAAPMNTGQNKVDQLQPFARDGRIHAAYGDTAPDILMLQMAQEPVAVFPDKKLKKTAVAQGWRVVE